jgi:hypothetical protein
LVHQQRDVALGNALGGTPNEIRMQTGSYNVTAGGALALDFDFEPRVQVGRIDRGAFELSEALFKNGFQ